MTFEQEFEGGTYMDSQLPGGRVVQAEELASAKSPGQERV